MITLLDKQACIEFYIDSGFTLFPLNGKHPPKDYHWRETLFDPFFEAERNFGIQLSATDLVVDVDPRNGGRETFEKIKRLLPATFKVITGSGGLHLYYKKPADLKIRKNLKEYPGIDFISEGGYVVGAGSVHPDTAKTYDTKDGVIVEASVELLDLIQKQKTELTKGTGKYADDEQTIQRYIDYLSNAPLAIEGQNGDATTFSVAATGRDFGLSPDCTYGAILQFYNGRCLPPWDADQLRLKVLNAYKYAHNEVGALSPQAVNFPKLTPEQEEKLEAELDKWFQRNKDGSIKRNLNNTAVLFANNFPVKMFNELLGFNEFTNNIEFLRPAPWHFKGESVVGWSDSEAIRCKFFLSNFFKFEPTTDLMHEAAYKAAIDHKFHPVREYLKNLKWDGHKRAHLWLVDIMGAKDNTYVRAVGLKWLVAGVKRIMEPGCKFDYLLTLESRQGTYKSQAFEILAVKKDWYCDPSIDITNKDSVFLIAGKWIVEMPEMHTHYRAETTAMKAFLSRSVDRVRVPYNRTSTDFPRQCIFAGTINPEANTDLGWLKDTTGNRRYWPVTVSDAKPADLEQLRLLVDQLWAEAYVLYLQGVKVYLEDNAVEDLARKEQIERMGVDPWQNHIEKWLFSGANLSVNIFTGEEIYRDCINGQMQHYTVKEMSRISRVMMNLGWVAGVHWDREAGTRRRGYKRPEIT